MALSSLHHIVRGYILHDEFVVWYNNTQVNQVNLKLDFVIYKLTALLNKQLDSVIHCWRSRVRATLTHFTKGNN